MGVGSTVAYLPDSLVDKLSATYLTTSDGRVLLSVRSFYVHGVGFDERGRSSIMLGTLHPSEVGERPPWKVWDLATKQHWIRSIGAEVEVDRSQT